MFKTLRIYFVTFWRFYVLILTPIVLLPIIFSGIPNAVSTNTTSFDGNFTGEEFQEAPTNNYEPMVCAYVFLLMAIYWMAEVLPLAVTSLIPIVAFPLFGVLSTAEVATNYMRATNFMMLGGLMLAVCVEHSGLHKRIALKIVLLMGTSPKMAMLGFMVTTAFVSMWISNAATAALMVPIVDAFAKAIYGSPKKPDKDDIELEQNSDSNSEYQQQRNLLLLSVAYSASIGGTGVITGNPSNLVVLEILPPEAGVSFATWMSFAVPLAIVNLIFCWLWLTQMSRWIGSKKKTGMFSKESQLTLETNFNSVSQLSIEVQEKEQMKPSDDDVKLMLQSQYDGLGPTTVHEWSILTCFSILILLWFFRQPMFITGWGDFLDRVTERGAKSSVADASPAMLMVIIIFILPVQYLFWPFQSSKIAPSNSAALINWDIIEKRLPWGVLLFLGGGFALSDACTKTGFSTWLVQYLVYLKHLPVWAINLIISMLTATITEVVSNTATANILLPIVKEMSLTLCQNPTYLVMCSVVTCCYAFMLPVATAPNAIVFQASTLRTIDMMKAGFLMNIICVLTTNIAINTYGSMIFGLKTFPDWASQAVEKIGINCTTFA